MDNIPVWELLTGLWTCTIEQGGYFCFEEKLQALDDEMEDLMKLKEDKERQVHMALEENMIPLQQVWSWLSKVDTMRGQIDQLKTKASEEMQNKCICGVCPKNFWTRYKMGKKIDGKLREVAKLQGKGEKFSTVATPAESTSSRLFRCMGSEGPGISGLYGAGGVGKTTQMNIISEDLLKSQSDFDFVIWVLVSQDVNLEQIQAKIAKEIGFLEDRWKEKNPEEKADEVTSVLRQKKFVLLLDDIWEQVDLTKVGVPLPRRGNGSKLIFTTRSEEVCNLMGAEENIPVGRLAWSKAWSLFQEKVGSDTLNSHPHIPKLAEDIARMCKGLPLALITTGRAMAGKKTIQEWHQSIEILKKSTSDVSVTDNPVLALLKFSYDNLPSEKVRSCLLYCTLFPEDFNMSKTNLIDYWIGEGFLGEYNHANGARTKGNEIIDILVSACLLEDDEKCVKMHDLVREMALWIACQCMKPKYQYFVEAGAKASEAPEAKKWEAIRRMSLMAHKIQNLTEAPRCDHLFTLFLGNNHLKTIADDFCQYMPSLRVLDLSGNRELTEFPLGISKLNSLEYLNFSRTGIKQLPKALKNLVKLRYLNLEYTYQLYTIPLQVISNFSHLNILRMAHCASSDRVIGDGIQAGGHQSLARDLEMLEYLMEFTVTISSSYSLQVFMSLDKFQTSTQTLCLHKFKHSKFLDISFLEGMSCLDDLEFTDCMDLNELRITDSLNSKVKCFDSLHNISVVNCSKLEDLTWIALAPNLESLRVSGCSNMGEIILPGNFEEANLHALEKLQILQLVKLPKLKSIHPNALPFPSLKEIVVDECRNLKQLPLDSNSCKEHRIVIQGWEDWWNGLNWKDDATRSVFQSSFKACIY